MAFDSDFEDDKYTMSDINMTPLVDVMLVLLIIFIIAVPVITHSVKVDLPHASNSLNDIKPETIQLTISTNGQVYWNEKPISSASLAAQLITEALKQPQPEIHIRADRKVEYEHVLQTMAAVQRAGLSTLGFVSEPK